MQAVLILTVRAFFETFTVRVFRYFYGRALIHNALMLHPHTHMAPHTSKNIVCVIDGSSDLTFHRTVRGHTVAIILRNSVMTPVLACVLIFIARWVQPCLPLSTSGEF